MATCLYPNKAPSTAHNLGCSCERCRQYKREMARDYRERNKEVLAEKHAERYAIRTEFIAAIKQAEGCIDCGYNTESTALHFDHIDPSTKLHSVGSMRNAAYPRLMAEIAKCEVRCANCHAVKTWGKDSS